MKAKSAFFQLRRLLCLAVLGAAFCGHAAPPFSAKIHAGAIERMERTSNPVNFVNIEGAIANDEVNPVDIVPEGLRVEVAPGDGEVFLIFTVAILPNRSLSTLDYRLRAGGAEHECKGMALESNNAFDLRRVVQKGPAMVKLLFSCPETAEEATLVNAFPNVPLTPVPTITLIEKTTPPPEPEAEAAADGEKDADAGKDASEEKGEKAAETAKTTEEADKTTEEADKKADDAKDKKTAAADKKPAAEEKPAAKPAPKPAAKPADNLWF
ncbi:MAG TPA: hypothetical protein PKY10_01420 [Lentisphaeria bacterium]|nr:hypothetical protein [Lentisphaeria bacterium]